METVQNKSAEDEDKQCRGWTVWKTYGTTQQINSCNFEGKHLSCCHIQMWILGISQILKKKFDTDDLNVTETFLVHYESRRADADILKSTSKYTGL